MRTIAKTFEEYFSQASERELALRHVDEAIKEAAPQLLPVLFQGMGGGAALGYGMQPYQTKSMKEPGEWPLVVLANQKNYMALYICALDNGEYIAEKNANRLGKVSVGKSCVRFKKIEDLNLTVVKDIVADIAKRIDKGEKLFGV